MASFPCRATDQHLLQDGPLFRIRGRGDPGQRHPLVQPHEVGATDEAAAVLIQRAQQQRRSLKTAVKGLETVAKSTFRASKRLETRCSEEFEPRGRSGEVVLEETRQMPQPRKP